MTAPQDTGPLDWRIGIVDAATGRPTPEFQRRWAIQRGNNSLIGSVQTGSGAPTSPATPEGALYVDESSTPLTLYMVDNGSWVTVGVYKFTDLKDVPSSYAGSAGELVLVNPGATGLEFGNISSILDNFGSVQGDILYRNATQWVVLPPGTAGQVLESGGTGANPSWVTGGGGGGATYTAPTISTFSFFYNPSGSSNTAITGGLQLVSASSSTISASIMQNIPTTPYTLWGRVNKVDQNYTSISGCGIALGDGTGKQIDVTFFFTGTIAPEIGYEQWNSATSRSSFTPINNGQTAMPPLIGINDDGTNLNFLASYDGVTEALPIFSISRTAWLSSGPTMVGIHATNYGMPITLNIAHWGPNLPGPI